MAAASNASKPQNPEDFVKFFTEQKLKGESIWVLIIRTTKESSKNMSNQIDVGQKAEITEVLVWT